MRRVESALGPALATVMIALAAAAPMPVRAGVLDCSRGHALSPSAARTARKAIVDAAGNRDILWTTQWSCVGRRTSHTQVDLLTEPRPDGSFITRGVHCYVDGDWKCDIWDGRHFTTWLVLGGIQRKITLRLPETFDVHEVDALLSKAFALAPEQTVHTSCEAASDQPPDSRVSNWLADFKQSFRLDGTEWFMEISEQNGKVQVYAGSDFLMFSRSTANPARLEYVCWDFDIVVT